MDSSAPLDEVPDSVDRGSPSDEEQPSASPAPEPAPESPGFGPNLVLFGDPDNGAHLQFTASKAHLLPSTKLRNAAEAMLSDVEEQERKRMRVDEDATLEIPGLESVDLPGAESHLIAPPMPLSEEQMRRKAENRVIHTHVQQSRRWIVNQIDQRRKACELVEQVNSPFQTMKEIWQALHCFHIFHVPTPSVSEKLHFEYMVNIRTMELIRRMEACEKRFHRLETFNANNPDLCDEILIKRLQCTLEQQNAESIHSELIQAQQSSSGRKSLDNLLMSSKPGMVLVNQGRMNQEHADASQLLKDVDI